MKKSYNNPLVEKLDFLPEDAMAESTSIVGGETGGGEIPDGPIG